jgi:dihydroflavonol-4-reductase
VKVLVTGSSGFIGSACVQKLLQQREQVRCLLRKDSNPHWLQGLPVEQVMGDFADVHSLESCVAGVDAVIHLAGVTKSKTRLGYYSGNFSATKNLLSACAIAGAKQLKFVYVSSQAAAGPSRGNKPVHEEDEPRPISLYGESKLLAEHAVMEFNNIRPATIVRPSSVYGPRDQDIFVYFKSVQRGLLLLLGKGTQKVSLIHVDDLVQGLLLAIQPDLGNGRVYFLCGDGACDWQTIGGMVAKVLQKKPLTLHVPIWLLKLVSLASRSLALFSDEPALLNSDKVREMKQAAWLCSNERAKAELRFAPGISLQDGLQQTAEWYKANKWL